MSEWWTYGLSDLLLFTPQTYYRLFELYNEAIWPLQLLALALGAAIPVLVFLKPVWQGRAITAILAASWIWVAWAYHLQRYATINWAAPFFAAAFAGQAVLLIWTGVIRNRLVYGSVTPVLQRTGIGISVFALAVEPLIRPLLGHKWVQAEIFGVAPDPTVIATLGTLLLADGRAFWELLLIPLIWCAISGAILWTMDSPAAFAAPLAATVAIIMAVRKTLRGRKRLH